MLADHCNDRKLAAKRAGDLSNDMFFGIFVRESGPLEEDGMVVNVMDQSLDVLVPELGVSFTFTKGEKEKPAELSLLWSVKLKSNDVTYEEEQELKIFNQVRVILTTESETEAKTSHPFKVMAKLVPSLKCGDEYYNSSTPAVDRSLKNKKKAAASPAVASPSVPCLPNTSDEIRRKLFDSEQEHQASRGSDVTAESKRADDVNSSSVNNKCEDDETASRGSDDVIVESEEDETSKLPNEATNAAEDDSDDVIVESESDPEQSQEK
ncbi:DIS3-like exonuclease 2 [Desmophyllum pertusum]|uniref:DIS3-like exonuclease 2 n=1 Tax=Desmophyllum pertusum TaxID=174260 RepID=A0A9W9YN95_9CNID|nr:DIS3-like exonuclease 2 [Desmophyllum pertusum]